MKKIIVIAVTIALIIAGCATDTVDQKNVLTGTITKVNDGNFIMTADDDQMTPYQVQINADTVYSDDVSKDFEVNNKVKVEHTGDLTGSDPVKINAKRIIENNKEV